MKFAFLIIGVLGHAAAAFTDADLATTLRERCDGQGCIFYFWSPNMPLSVRGRGMVSRYAQINRLTLITLLDPASSPRLAEGVRLREHWPKETTTVAEAKAFIRLGIRVHYPSYLFARHGRISGPLVPGVRSERELASLTSRLTR